MLILATLFTKTYKITSKSILFQQCHLMFTLISISKEPFGSLTKNCIQLDKNKSIVSTSSVQCNLQIEIITVISITLHGIQ